MGSTKKIPIFCMGTWTTSNKRSNHFIGKVAASAMHDERDFIWQLYVNCQDVNKLILDGAGTDIVFSNTWSVRTLFKTVAGGIDGHIGENSIRANLEKIKKFIREQAKSLTGNEAIEVDAIGWSRGAFTVMLLKTAVAELIEEGINIISLYLDCLDPVLGGPTDRLRILFSSQKDPEIDVFVDTYYSHTGNLNVWDRIAEYLHEQFHINLPFFSAVLENTKNKTGIRKNGDTYEHRSNKYILPANHEGVNGRCLNENEELVARVVLACLLIKSRLNYRQPWKNDAIEKGKTALQELRRKGVIHKTARKFLDLENAINCLIGREISENDSVLSIHTAPLYELNPNVDNADDIYLRHNC